MAINFMNMFGSGEKITGLKTLVVKTERCPQNHRCPAVQVCPVGALSQKGFSAPVIDYETCTSCGKCARYCFPRALVMEKKG